MKKIFIVTYGGGHAKIAENIYYKLKQRENFNVVILGLTGAKNYLKDKGINVKGILNYKYNFKNNLDIIDELVPPYVINNHMTEDEHYFYNRISIDELLNKHGYDKTVELLNTFSKRVYLPASFMKDVLIKENPDVVLTTNSPRMERAALLSSKNLGIPTIQIEDLFGIRSYEDTLIDNSIDSNIYTSTMGDYIFVLNELSKKNILSRGVEENRIKITGNPNFDSIIKFKENKKYLEKKDQFILYLAQQTPDFENILSYLNNISLNNNFNIIVKLHPNQKIINNNYSNLLFIKDNLYENIINSSLVITETSTSGLESLVLNKKLLSIQLKEEYYDIMPFDMYKNAIIINKLDNLEETIKYMLDNDEINKYKSEFYHGFDSSEKCCNEILKIINNK